MDRITILRGVAGSVAQGLATPESDVDEHGVFSYPTRDFWSLEKPAESIVTNSPDVTMHELEKFLRLAVKANPSVLDTLWLDDYLEAEPVWGPHLLAIRRAFLSAKPVQAAYLGYANAQFKKLRDNDKKLATLGSAEENQSTVGISEPYFESATKNRTRKHAKHLIRLLEQGMKLYTTGEMSVRVENPERYFEIMNEWPLAQVATYATEQMSLFEDAVSCLPVVPEFRTVNNYLHDYRAAHC